MISEEAKADECPPFFCCGEINQESLVLIIRAHDFSALEFLFI